MSKQHPFILYRESLTAFRRWREHGRDAAEFDALVLELDAAVVEVDGRGMVHTPMVELRAAGKVSSARVFAKVEAQSVSGSHKSRHIFGLMLDLLVQEQVGELTERRPLAIASCGNAALAAAVVAAAVKWPLNVYVPANAPQSTLNRLAELSAKVVVARRKASDIGDPTVLRFREDVASGAIPFCCQGTEAPGTFDGGVVLGREIVADLERRQIEVDHVFIQVGGGALMSAIWRGMSAGCSDLKRRRPRFHSVQTLGGYPLVRGWRIAIDDVAARLGTGMGGAVEPRVAVEIASGPSAAEARAAAYRRMDEEPECYMWAWHNVPKSIATGILDDETYDFVDCVKAMIDTGGVALAVAEQTLRAARDLTEDEVETPISYTGAAGLAGLLAAHELGIVRAGDKALVILSGVRR